MQRSLESKIISLVIRVENAHEMMCQRRASLLGRFLFKSHSFRAIETAFLKGQELVYEKKYIKGLPYWLKMLDKSIDFVSAIRGRLAGRLVFRSRDIRALKRTRTIAGRMQQSLERSKIRSGSKLAAKYFDFAYYLKELGRTDLAGLTAFEHYLKEGWRAGLSPHPLFDVEYYLQQHPQLRLAGKEPFEYFLSSGPHDKRNPCALFNARWYLAQNLDVEDATMNALVHYLDFGSMEGRLANPVFSVEEYRLNHAGEAEYWEDAFLHFLRHASVEEKVRLQEATFRYLQEWEYLLYRPVRLDRSPTGENDARAFARAEPVSCAVHIHAYYLDVLERMLDYMKRIPFSYDIFISTNNEEKKLAIAGMLSAYVPGKTCHIHVVPNRGRDVAPLFVGLGNVLLGYDLALHLHTKKTPHLAGGAGDEWLMHNLDYLLPEGQCMHNLQQMFQSQQDCGVVFPRAWCGAELFVDMRNNRLLVNRYLVEMGIDLEILDHGRVMFPAGNMFWFRPEAIRPMLSSNLTYEDFPNEPLPSDGTLAHAIERCTLYVAHSRGYRNYMIESHAAE